MPSHQTIPQRAEVTLTHFVRNPRPIIFDVGANRGQSYRRLRKLFPGARIWSFEPDPEMFALLNRAMAEDPLAHAVAAAVGSANGSAMLYRSTRSGTNSLSQIREDTVWAREIKARQRDSIVTPLLTLDRYCAQQQIDRIDFVKFDIQGFEPEALQGAQGLLRDQCIDLLQIELIPAAFYDRVTHFSDVERWLLPHGYRLMTIHRIVTDDEGLLRACDVLYGLQRPALS